MHVPTDEFAAALKMNAKQWKDAYRCPKPGPGDALVMQCRTNRRAAWAAQLALDHGLQNCLVYRQVGFAKKHLGVTSGSFWHAGLANLHSESIWSI